MTQRIFRQLFNIHRNDSVTSGNTVLLWVRNCRETASTAKSKRPAREPSLRAPENIEGLRQAFVRIPPLAGMCWQHGTPPHRHYIQGVNIVIIMLWDRDKFGGNSRKKTVHFPFYWNLKIVRFFCLKKRNLFPHQGIEPWSIGCPVNRLITTITLLYLLHPHHKKNFSPKLTHKKNFFRYKTNRLKLRTKRIIFDVLLTVHLSILTSVINQLYAQNFVLQ